MTTQRPSSTHQLSDTRQTVANPHADVRGHAVVDRDGHKIGRIDDLLVDHQTKSVLFLRVTHGGVLGFGATHYLVPVEAVVAVHTECVEVDQQRSGTGDVPAYHGNVYGWWGQPALLR